MARTWNPLLPLNPHLLSFPHPHPILPRRRCQTSSLPPSAMSSHGTHSSSTTNLVGVHYRVGKKIGEGSFGVIFEGGSKPYPPICPPIAFSASLNFRDADTTGVLQERTCSTPRQLLSNLYVDFAFGGRSYRSSYAQLAYDGTVSSSAVGTTQVRCAAAS